MHEAGLPDTRLADDGDDLTASGDGSLGGIEEDRELRGAADEAAQAVCGDPHVPARQTGNGDKLEDLDRDRYAGPLGWVDARADGEWYLGIRSAVVEGSSARLFAGVGIVEDSDAAAELAETQLKFQAFLAAAVRP